MFKARAVWRTQIENHQFNDAGFEILVDLSYNNELGRDKTEELFSYIRDGRCDGFEIDLGTSKQYFMKS